MKNLGGYGIYAQQPSDASLSFSHGHRYREKEVMRKLLERVSKERYSSQCKGRACQHLCTRQNTRQTE